MFFRAAANSSSGALSADTATEAVTGTSTKNVAVESTVTGGLGFSGAVGRDSDAG